MKFRRRALQKLLHRSRVDAFQDTRGDIVILTRVERHSRGDDGGVFVVFGEKSGERARASTRVHRVLHSERGRGERRALAHFHRDRQDVFIHLRHASTRNALRRLERATRASQRRLARGERARGARPAREIIHHRRIRRHRPKPFDRFGRTRGVSRGPGAIHDAILENVHQRRRRFVAAAVRRLAHRARQIHRSTHEHARDRPHPRFKRHDEITKRLLLLFRQRSRPIARVRLQSTSIIIDESRLGGVFVPQIHRRRQHAPRLAFHVWSFVRRRRRVRDQSQARREQPLHLSTSLGRVLGVDVFAREP